MSCWKEDHEFSFRYLEFKATLGYPGGDIPPSSSIHASEPQQEKSGLEVKS